MFLSAREKENYNQLHKMIYKYVLNSNNWNRLPAVECLICNRKSQKPMVITGSERVNSRLPRRETCHACYDRRQISRAQEYENAFLD